MTIELQTGLPGNGKTLFTLDRIEEIRKKTGRPVFYSGIPIYPEKLPEWTELEDPKKWFECPPESIIVIDEAQRIFRPRASGSAVPEYEARLETHRHGGIDLVLLTQRPGLVSLNVRELCGKHLHIVRTFGMNRGTVHEWQECKLNTQARKDSIKHLYTYNKKVFTWYKSAEAHTYKANIPMKVWLLGAIIVGLPIGIYFISQHLKSIHEPTPLPGKNMFSPGESAKGGPPVEARVEKKDWVEQFRPRVAGLHYTAPVYDDVTKPVRAPIPAACVEMGSRCKCYTQQATLLDVPPDLCRGIVAGGFFVAWDEREKVNKVSANPSPVAQKLEGEGPASWTHMAYSPPERQIPIAKGEGTPPGK